jgi:hypothetical protein
MRHLLILGTTLFALTSPSNAADTPQQMTVELTCSVILTVPAVDQTPGPPLPPTLSPTLPQTGGGPGFATYYVSMDLTRGTAELHMTDPDGTPWATFSAAQDLLYLRDHTDFYYMDHGHYTDTVTFPPDRTDLAFWVGRVTGWFELIKSTYNPPSPYSSKSWEVGVCGQRGWKF